MSNRYSGGTNLDSIFEPRDGRGSAQSTGHFVGNQDLGDRYLVKSEGAGATAGATGIYAGGNDLNQLFTVLGDVITIETTFTNYDISSRDVIQNYYLDQYYRLKDIKTQNHINNVIIGTGNTNPIDKIGSKIWGIEDDSQKLYYFDLDPISNIESYVELPNPSWTFVLDIFNFSSGTSFNIADVKELENNKVFIAYRDNNSNYFAYYIDYLNGSEIKDLSNKGEFKKISRSPDGYAWAWAWAYIEGEGYRLYRIRKSDGYSQQISGFHYENRDNINCDNNGTLRHYISSIGEAFFSQSDYWGYKVKTLTNGSTSMSATTYYNSYFDYYSEDFLYKIRINFTPVYKDYYYYYYVGTSFVDGTNRTWVTRVDSVVLTDISNNKNTTTNIGKESYIEPSSGTRYENYMPIINYNGNGVFSIYLSGSGTLYINASDI